MTLYRFLRDWYRVDRHHAIERYYQRRSLKAEQERRERLAALVCGVNLENVLYRLVNEEILRLEQST